MLLVDASFQLRRSDLRYPATLTTHLSDRAPELVSVLGNLEILQRETLALFCSVRCPGNLIVQTYDLAHDGVGYSTSGGFIDDIKAQIEEYAAKIKSGEIKVPSKP